MIVEALIALAGIGMMAFGLNKAGYITLPGRSASIEPVEDDFTATIPQIASLPSEWPKYVTSEQLHVLADQTVKRYSLRPSPELIVTIATLESGSYSNPGRHNRFGNRYESHIDDTSYGLMQNLYRNNARWLHDSMGYTGKPLASPDSLYDPETSVYFGAAYLDWLIRTYGGTTEQIARRYNGGPRGDRVAQTAEYWRRYQIANATLKEKGTFYA